MKYVGSKNRLAKYIVPILQTIIEGYNPSLYVEPFVGGANIIDKIRCVHIGKWGIDNNFYLIQMWVYLIHANWNPPETISEEFYIKVRDNKEEFPPHVVGLVGFCATYGAKWFGGYARGFKADKITPRDIPNEGIRNIKKQISNLQDTLFIHGEYSDFLFTNAVIYCDPPYKGTSYYKDKFDHEEFYEWCRKTSENNIVVISEYWMPNDFICMWRKTHKTSLDTDTHYDRVEKLFIHEKNLDEVSRILKEKA